MRKSAVVVAVLVGCGLMVARSDALRRGVLAVRILDELRRPGRGALSRATPEPSWRTIQLEGAHGSFEADVYEPGAGSGWPLLFLPGAVVEGKDEPRIAPFARLLARAGFRVVVPSLPSFQTLRVQAENETEAAAALEALTARSDLAPEGRAGIFAVSYAGGIALLVAMDRAHAGRVSFLASVGGYADLDSALHYLVTGRTSYRGEVHQARPGPYGSLVFVRTFQEFIRSPIDSELVERMVSRRLADPRAPLRDLARGLSPAVRPVYDLFETAAPESVPRLIASLPAALLRRMADLSPARRPIDALAAHLYLIHALDDEVFPVGDAERIAARARRVTRVRLLVLRALQHVDLGPWHRDPRRLLTQDLPEVWGLGAWWWDLLGERRAPAARRAG